MKCFYSDGPESSRFEVTVSIISNFAMSSFGVSTRVVVMAPVALLELMDLFAQSLELSLLQLVLINKVIKYQLISDDGGLVQCVVLQQSLDENLLIGLLVLVFWLEVAVNDVSQDYLVIDLLSILLSFDIFLILVRWASLLFDLVLIRFVITLGQWLHLRYCFDLLVELVVISIPFILEEDKKPGPNFRTLDNPGMGYVFPVNVLVSKSRKKVSDQFFICGEVGCFQVLGDHVLHKFCLDMLSIFTVEVIARAVLNVGALWCIFSYLKN